jgi:uncharacterized protein with von Willebrand factor type A (vWA) domain
MASEQARLAAEIAPRLSELAAALRTGGVRCGVDQLLLAHRVLAEVEPTRAMTRAALRCALCRSPEDHAVFERAFVAVFGAESTVIPSERPADAGRAEGERLPGASGSNAEAQSRRRAVDARELGDRTHGEAEGEPLASPAQWSPVEIERERSFRDYGERERVRARPYLRHLALALPTRMSASLETVASRGRMLDTRGTIRGALSSGGDPLDLRWLSPARTQRRLVFVCDLSGSMAPYARMVLEYVHAIARAGRGVEAFCFATTLERITHEIRDRDVDRAIARAEQRLPGRAGGTRIGAAIASLNREHRGPLGRGAIVAILSDGWDRGEPELLAREMARLRRTAHRVLWLDPNVGGAGYEPLTRGMREALPHVDRLLPGDTLRALEALAEALRQGLPETTSRARLRRPA